MKELLSPAGDFLSLKAAIHAGCDAVYIGGLKFGARKFANNFSNEELESAIKYAHLYGVKVYVTVNTMIYDKELDDAIKYVEFLHKINVDAIIIQDIGLIKIVHEKYPNLELHASTQLHNYTEENFKLLEELGIKRVVLARENTLEEIKNINTKLEKEVFIHGAICISYSGQCLFSSIILNRSGNRGECAGMCRLPYELKIENEKIKLQNEYLLSPKELSTLNNFKQLMESDITSFKIEGRMKSPTYVYYITKLYRTLIDKYNENKYYKLTDTEIKNLSTIYNREFTEGKLFNKENEEFINPISPNHIGIPLGRVLSTNNKFITIELEEDLNQEDGIRFTESNKGMIVNYLYDKKGLLISNAKKGDIVRIDNKLNIKNKKQPVRKTIDKKLNDLLNRYPLKKIDIDIEVKAHYNEPLEITILDNQNKITEIGNIVEKSINRSITKEEIEKQLRKLGNTPFSLKNIKIDIENNIFITLSELNNIRRTLTEKLTHTRENKATTFRTNEVIENRSNINQENTKLTCLVRNEKQLNIVKNYPLKRIYITDKEIYKKYKEQMPNLYLRVERLSKNNLYHNERLLITELSQLNLIKNNTCITDYYLNVANHYYMDYLKDKVESITLSVENKLENLYNLTKLSKYYNLEVVVYGRIELMIMKHCILGNMKKEKCINCNLCDKKSYLIDRNNKEYPILANHDKINHILNYRSDILNINEVKECIKDKISTIRIEFYDEDEEEIIKTLANYLELL